MTEKRSLLHPVPRRPFELSPAPSEPATPSTDRSNSEGFESRANGGTTPDRSRSILNLTASTLYGIYSPTGGDLAGRDESTTPWGTGAQTPSVNASPNISHPPVFTTNNKRSDVPAQSRRKKDFRFLYLPLAIRGVLLFVIGVAYGIVITHLHDNSSIAPVKIGAINRQSRIYLACWGLSGIVLGSLLPWIDTIWTGFGGATSQLPPSPRRSSLARQSVSGEDRPSLLGDDLGASWNPAVRSVGAFIGIAFAIRRLPWESTFQMSLTLAVADPALWYLIDRSTPGFILSILVGVLGTIISLAINPGLVPPAASSATAISQELVGVFAWVASVLFCSCVCFGNIGRRLALTENHESGMNRLYWSISSSI